MPGVAAADSRVAFIVSSKALYLQHYYVIQGLAPPHRASPAGAPPRGRQKGQSVAQRPPAPPPAPGFTPTVDASGGAVAPELSEADRTMLMRN